ncbi:MAG: DUF58 domain-containing protein [Eubacterium sp.]|nr:DUF58 domain-containing protein [Eubacterium sp.]
MRTVNVEGLAGLTRLRFTIKNKAVSQYEGGRRSNIKGRSTEFSGYREYIPGDDMRYVDWNAYGRLDKLYIKEYMEEREGVINIFLDTSKSMDYGSQPKDEIMAGLAQAICFVADKQKDSVTVTDLAEPLKTMKLPKGRLGMMRLKAFLANSEIKGKIDLGDAIKKAAIGKHGLTFIISDYYDEGFLDEEVELCRYMRYLRHDVVLLQVLSREELEIDETGAARMHDSEKVDDMVTATFDRETVESYMQALKDFKKELSGKAEKAGAGYYLCRTDRGLGRILLEDMRGLYDI